MLRITQGSFNELMPRLLKKFSLRPDLLRRMVEGDKVSNRELFELVKAAFPIDDPLIEPIHRRIIESFSHPLFLVEDIFLTSKVHVWLWYAALKEEERRGGEKVPRLQRDYVEEHLPLYIPPGGQITIHMNLEEVEGCAIILEVVDKRLSGRGGLAEELRTVVSYPIVVLTRLLNGMLRES